MVGRTQHIDFERGSWVTMIDTIKDRRGNRDTVFTVSSGEAGPGSATPMFKNITTQELEGR